MEKPKRYRAKVYNGNNYVEGYYFEYHEMQGYWVNNSIVSCIVSYHTGDWGLDNTPYFCRIDVDTLEEIEE